MSLNAFLFIVSFFLVLCGSILIFAAWPQRILRPAPLEAFVLLLGGTMVFASGFGLAMAVA